MPKLDKDTSSRTNKLDIIDYFKMRENNQASNIKWQEVKRLNTHLGDTLWQLFAKLDDYNVSFEPSKTHISKIRNILEY